ncbi:hypothetical protein QAD02_016382 [Eretmocerus hayati]|uniref:Uncharacterized protein n=1 Tax=Eretmocerus hayati TaxID=131215 RepID=A0ACC2PFQ3_9HYME|nr:hypothetical protein QAD02_016382 [Eretmocerus hayati]
MVCKENVVSWFGNLSSYKRIDVMCTLLNMCLPFEVRFIGTCVEDLGKREYNVLRDTEHRANNVTDLAELSNLGITDKRTRRKITLYMALLHSCNYACAVVLYKNLANFNFQEVSNLLSETSVSQDDQPLEELLLLYTMAINHPAFNYEQKSTFGNIFLKLQEEEERLSVPQSGTVPFKSAQSCVPCEDQSDRMDPEVAANCVMAPPPMQAFQGEMQIRGKTMIAGMPPGMSIPPPGICIPSPEQIAMHGGGHPQYLHLGFPSMNHMPPWTGQVMMAHNQILYHPADVLPYSTSPLVSRQSSPSPSQSHSRSNSPTSQIYQRKSNSSSNNAGSSQPMRNSTQIPPAATNSLTTSTSIPNIQTNMSGSNTLGTSTPSLPSIGAPRSLPQQQTQSLPPLMPSRSVGPMSNTTYARHNNVDSSPMMVSKQQQQPPPPRLKPPVPGELLRETGNKEMPNFKGNFQNSSNTEIRRLSDDDVSRTDVTPNVLNTIKNQTTNGLNQTPEQKFDGPNSLHSPIESVESEVLPTENDNSTVKPVTIPEHAVINYQQNHTMPNTRRYPPTLDPAPIQMFPAPPGMYPSQNTCYSCLTAVPMSGMQNRFARCNTPQLYCLTGLQQLRIDPDNRNCSQSSSSDSTGSRSPPETPPAIPWTGNDNPGLPLTNEQQQQQHTSSSANPPPHHPIVATHPVPPQQQPQQQQQQQPQQQQERPRPRKSQTHIMRHKSHSSTSGMVNGGGPPPQPPTSLQPCMSFPAPPGHSPMTAYLPHHAHFPALRPTTGIYTNFTHAYARPTPAGYSTIAYQPNGEMMYQYPGHPLPGNTANVTTATGTPPPPAVASAPVAVQSVPASGQVVQQQVQPPQSYVATTPVVAYTQPMSPAKISCYNCGSNAHTAAECKEQTMEDITRRAQYRLDYATAKQLGGEQSQSSDK